jgi:hypothetical protein
MKKNIVSQKVIFGIYDNDAEAMASTDLSASCSVQISKDGAAFAAGTGAFAEVLGVGSTHIGQFSYTPTQAETNADCIKFIFACSGGTSYNIDSQVLYTTNWAIAGDQMDLVNTPNGTAITAIQNGLSKPGTAQTITPADTAAATTAQTTIAKLDTMLEGA